LDSTGVLVSRFVYATGVNVPDYMVKGGTNYRLLTDHLGSVRLVINATTGFVVQRLDYDEFGQITQDTNPGFQPFGFAGGFYDPDTRLSRFGERDYDAFVGRWTTKDPIRFVAGDPNLYSYALADPVSYFDPLGLDIWIEGPSGREPSRHQSVNVGDPLGEYSSYSYGMNGSGMEGEVYRDTELGGPIEAYKKTTPEQDAEFKKLMESQLGKKSTYGWDDICRSWSQRAFKNAPGTSTSPPVRKTRPHTNVGPSSPRSTTGTSSTTGTWTSR
jgi:RHS repeat-associated protein